MRRERWIIAGVDIGEDFRVVGHSLRGFVSSMLQFCDVLVLAAPIHKDVTKERLQKLLKDIAGATGNKHVLLLTRPNLEPARIAYGLMRCIEMTNIMHMDIETTLREFGGSGGTPVWAFNQESGWYVNSSVEQCPVHPYSQRFKGKHCIGFFEDIGLHAMRCDRVRHHNE